MIRLIMGHFTQAGQTIDGITFYDNSTTNISGFLSGFARFSGSQGVQALLVQSVPAYNAHFHHALTKAQGLRSAQAGVN